MCHLEANCLIIMISYGVFQERNTTLTHNVEYDLREASKYGFVLPTYIGLHGYICYELVFDARGAVSYVYHGIHGIGIISSLYMVQ
jgi:hypothetical protein